MSKRVTISTRWKLWAEKEPILAYTALFLFGGAIAGLILHLAVLSGFLRQLGLIILVVGDAGAILITGLRKQFWWFTFFLTITACVIAWELASYFFGSTI